MAKWKEKYRERVANMSNRELYEEFKETIIDYYDDCSTSGDEFRFKYRGFYFSELSRMDKNKFEDHSITIGYLENPDKRAIFESFIKLNTCGKPMAKKHIDHVKKLLEEFED